jgi:hypothetical protein
MADRYYVRKGQVRPNGAGTWDVVIRFDVPAGDNDVSVSWTTAAAESYAAAESPASEWPGENDTLLAAGTEVEIQFRHKDNVNNPGLATRLEAAVVAAIATEKTKLQDQLRFWGKTATV